MDRTKSQSLKPTGLRERSRQATLKRIRTAAIELMAERGYDQMTTREIAERAEVGEATLFRYLNSKHDLLLLVIGDTMDRHIDALVEADARDAQTNYQGASHFVNRIYAVYGARTEFYLQDPENVTSYLQNALVAGSQLGAQNAAQGDRVLDLVADIIRQGQLSGFLSNRVDAHVVAQNCQGIYVHEILRRSGRDFAHETLGERVHTRLQAQLVPLVIREVEATTDCD
ncbi:TetR/AcrR family transcriptional regulator [Arthrobacter sp. KNU40]|uniref:TetR/AcrR family transcriptional regulator n=1 Tax=Arthrobacter sp. KNU40 TaxID=3447965 RepID=UPI003F63B10B